MAYKKASDTPSMLQLQPTLMPPAELATTNTPQWMIWLLGILGVGLVAGSLGWFLRSRQVSAPAKSKARARHRSTAPKQEPVPDSQGYIYCQNCGSRAASGDVFCRSCGAKLRK
jgi:hypothetical protein